MKPGVTTKEIDDKVINKIIEKNCYPSPLNYHGFPRAICTSINEIMCHGIPDNRELEEGDIISIDVSVFTEDGYHGDCANTFKVGENVDQNAINLIETTREALNCAIELCGDGVKFSEIGNKIEDIAISKGFSVSPDFCGHGIGSEFHMLPFVLHTKNYEKEIMQKGMTFTIG